LNLVTHVYQDIPGWFDWETTYRRWAEQVRPDGVIVEVGAYLGKSLSFLLVELQNLERYDVQVHAVDNWVGPEPGVDGFAGLELEREFHNNIRSLMIRPAVHRMRSLTAASTFPPEAVDMVWLDGSHTFEDVYADLEAWWPLVRPGGEIGGHDLTSFAGVQKAVAMWSKRQGVEYRVLPSCHNSGPVTSSWLMVKAHG
jgi:hypothetical protein